MTEPWDDRAFLDGVATLPAAELAEAVKRYRAGQEPVFFTIREHLEKALECLTDEFNAGRAGPSGLRAQAIAHVRYALLLERGRMT